MAEQSIPAIMAPARARDNPWTRSIPGMIGMGFLAVVLILCLVTLVWARRADADQAVTRYEAGDAKMAFVPPFGLKPGPDEVRNLNSLVPPEVQEDIAARHGLSVGDALKQTEGPVADDLRAHWPLRRAQLGTDALGRSLLVRVLAGGGISLTIGIAAALLAVFIGTIYGALSGYIGGKTDAVMMRIVDILYGLPYVLLVVLLAVAVEAVIDETEARTKERVAWVKSQERQLAKAELGSAPDPAAFEAWTAEPPSAATREALIDLMHRSLLKRWEYDREQSEKEARARDAALASADTPKERELAEAMPVRSVAPTPPTVEDAVAEVDQAASVHDAVARCGDLAIWPRLMKQRARERWDMVALLVAIGAVSWLTLARVVRGQVLSLKNQPFIEAARAMGASGSRIFIKHLLPNLVGPITVYATLTVPQAILQESFLSFLGIGVKPPMPSWGNLAAEGLTELNVHRSHWWLLAFPCILLGSTLLALNFVGEGLREAFDPRRARS